MALLTNQLPLRVTAFGSPRFPLPSQKPVRWMKESQQACRGMLSLSPLVAITAMQRLSKRFSCSRLPRHAAAQGLIDPAKSLEVALAAELSKPFGDRLIAGVGAARAAATLAAELQQRVVQGDEKLNKADASVVTIADFAAQALVLQCLAQDFEDDGFIAEETSASLQDAENAPSLTPAVLQAAQKGAPSLCSEKMLFDAIDLGGRGKGERFTWVLDPIDGTRGFVAGQQYCIGLALLEDGVPQLGILACPNDAGGRLFMAARGHGSHVAFLNAPGSSERLRCQAPSPLSKGILMEGPFTDAARGQRVREMLGIEAPPMKCDSMVKYGRLAAGEGNLILRLVKEGYRENVWDHAAGSLVVSEAGGVISDLQGRCLDFSLGPRLAPEVRGIVASSCPELQRAALDAIARL